MVVSLPLEIDMQMIGIATIEAAINGWSKRYPPNLTLCRQVRVLADVYGDMIYRRALEIDATTLDAEQLCALAVLLPEPAK